MMRGGRLGLLLLATTAGSAAAQEAIVDTARPFVANAREEEQFLRGPVGWPTYQAGMAGELIYRFDPDGYARFGPTERLDEDFWEITCTPQPVDCTARRGVVLVGVGPDRRPTLTLESSAAGARFKLGGEDEGPGRTAAELTAPVNVADLLGASVLLPVAGGEPVPLDGLGTAVAYMQWVEAGQPDDLRLDADPRRAMGDVPAPASPQPSPPAPSPTPLASDGQQTDPTPSPPAVVEEEVPAPDQQTAATAPAIEPLPPPTPNRPQRGEPAAEAAPLPPPGSAPAASPGVSAQLAAQPDPEPPAARPQPPGPPEPAPASRRSPAASAPKPLPQSAAPAVATAACAPGSLPPAQLLKPVDSLRALPGIQLVTDLLAEPASLKGKLRPALRRLAEERLKAAGIRLLTTAEVEQVPGKPRLEFYLTRADPARGCPFRIWMSLRQEVALARDSSIRLITGTWGDGGASRAGSAEGAELETFAYYIDRFIKDWQTAKASRPTTASPPGVMAPAATNLRSPAREETASSAGPDATAQEAASAASASDDPDAVLGIQAALRDAGYEVGTVDGRLGQRTRAAIRAFERDHGLPITGLASRPVLERLIARRAELPP